MTSLHCLEELVAILLRYSRQKRFNLLQIERPRIVWRTRWLAAELLNPVHERAFFGGIFFERFDHGALLVFEMWDANPSRGCGILL